MLKHHQIPIASSNIALFGSDVEKKIKHEAAEGEPAWKTAGKETGLQIWRVKQFKLDPVPAKEAGSFYTGDSYIVLHTIKGNDGRFSWDIFFWLGEKTSQDEAGTAAYKTVELDDHLSGAPVQHREIQGYETDEFVELFSNKGGIRVLSGGFDSGFTHVKPEEYQPRLLHVQGTTSRNVKVYQVELSGKSLNSSDTFILDAGLKIYQFNGKHSKPIEKNKASTLANAIKDERESGSEVIVLDEDGGDLGEFWKFFGGPQTIAASSPAPAAHQESPKKVLFRLSDASGSLQFTKVAEGQLNRSSLDSKDVFLLDAGFQVFVWVGNGASRTEKRTALQYAVDYLKKENRPTHLPISRILEGGENEVFRAQFS